jgi:hypothetical protein
MTEWYYARGGQQSGPVTLEQLRDLAKGGGLDPKDLVWNSTMKDWTPAGQVAGVFSSAAAVMPAPVSQQPPADPSNPYAAPQSAWVEPVRTSSMAEIIPGSEPLDAVACVKRGFDLTKRKFGEILLVGVVYFALLMGLGFVIGLVQGIAGAVGAPSGGFQPSSSTDSSAPSGVVIAATVLGQTVNQVFSMFLGLGLTRVGLNLVSGKPVEVSMLFCEGNKLLRVIGASIIFFFAAGIGMLLLIVPGVYIMLRYGQYMTAIVDRNMGIMESFSYSSSITTNNRLNIFVLWLLSIPVIIAGFLACGVGLIFAGPVVWLAFAAAYRWMQYGHQAVTDQPGTSTPTLSGI